MSEYLSDKEKARQERDAKDEKFRIKQVGADLRFVMQSSQGRRLMRRILHYCDVFSPIWHPSAMIHRNAGRQELGQDLLRFIQEESPSEYLAMIREDLEESQKIMRDESEKQREVEEE
jgi:hypothetical protein